MDQICLVVPILPGRAADAALSAFSRSRDQFDQWFTTGEST